MNKWVPARLSSRCGGNGGDLFYAAESETEAEAYAAGNPAGKQIGICEQPIGFDAGGNRPQHEPQPDETLDDLLCGGLRVLQKRRYGRFGIDAALLANFARAKRGACVVELCSGTGVISILMSAKTPARTIIGIEIQEELVSMANRSAALNGLCGRVSFRAADLRDNAALPPRASQDAVVVNPPYLPAGSGASCRDPGEMIARHEVCCTLDDTLAAAAYMLKPGGALYIVHRAGRAADVICGMREAGIEPRAFQFAHPRPDAPAALALIEGWVHPSARRNPLVARGGAGGTAGAGSRADSPLLRAEARVLPPIFINQPPIAIIGMEHIGMCERAQA